jgi:hypothetical protein
MENTLRTVDRNIPFTAVRASRGKVTRAEPVSALYDQGRMHHIGTFVQLEDQMTSFTSDFDRQSAGYSPDRVDALVWAVTDLMLTEMKGYAYYEVARRMAMGETKAEIAGTVSVNGEPPKHESLQDIYERVQREIAEQNKGRPVFPVRASIFPRS